MPTLSRPLPHNPARATPLRCVALGDSLIYGYGDPEGGGWVERLRRQWMHCGDEGHVMYNLGVRGDGVQQVLQRLEGEFRCRGELRHRVPDCVILSVGVNDSCRVGRAQGRLLTPPEQFQQMMGELLHQAQQLCPVLFVGMVPVVEAAMPFAQCLYYGHADQQQYNDAIRQACLARNVPHLNLLEAWLSRGDDWWRSRLSSDGLHPNAAGYSAILQEVLAWQAFTEIFKTDSLVELS
ncbi:MAG: GDSL-type esterase/lipase family protein [Cyanobacteria bacterium P01_A01_bin.135]